MTASASIQENGGEYLLTRSTQLILRSRHSEEKRGCRALRASAGPTIRVVAPSSFQPTTARLSVDHLQHDLPDVRAALHQPMGGRRFGQRAGVARTQVDYLPDLVAQRPLYARVVMPQRGAPDPRLEVGIALSLRVVDRVRLAAHVRDVAFLEIDDLVGGARQGHGVGREEVFARADTDHQRRALILVLFFFALAAGQNRTAPALAQGSGGVTVGRDYKHDVSPPLRDIQPVFIPPRHTHEANINPHINTAHTDQLDPVVQSSPAAAAMPSPLLNFNGIPFPGVACNCAPPDTNGEVGLTQYVQIVNEGYQVFNKSTGASVLGPVGITTIWSGFGGVCQNAGDGDPVVLYDQLEDRWILTQFTTRGPEYWDCVAVSQTGDPTGAYYRYAFSTGTNFPDYPKYGLWRDSYIITTREFGPTVEYGIGVYALERDKMLEGDPNARVASFFLDGNAPGMLPLVGDGLLPPDIDGKTKPASGAPAPLVGTQDDNSNYGATFDALNIWELSVKWQSNPAASIALKTQLPVASFDSIFPCGVVPSTTPGVSANSRDCLPQPGVTDGSRFLDILSYRQRPTFRLAYRNFKGYESLVTNQSVEAAPGVAGVRWYEIRRTNGVYSLYQQGTYAPGDGVHRWMGSIAQDKNGNMALGYSVVNATDVYPGIRYTGRLNGDPLGQMTLGEGVVINGSGVQRSTNSRWGDYTDMTVDPADDCTFWYVNEYYTLAGQLSSPAGWQTRIASFKLPGCQ